MFAKCKENKRFVINNVEEHWVFSFWLNVFECFSVLFLFLLPIRSSARCRPSPAIAPTYGRTIFIVTNLNFTLLSAAHPGASGECFCFFLIPIFLALICGSGSQQVGASIHRFTMFAAAHPGAIGKCFCFCCSLSFLLELEALLEARDIYTSRRIFCLKDLQPS